MSTREPKGEPGGIATATAPPTARVIARFEKINHARRADRVVIRHGRGKVFAIIEIVSPGNEDSRNVIRSFVEEAADILDRGVNLLGVDLFPPTPRDPQGIHVRGRSGGVRNKKKPGRRYGCWGPVQAASGPALIGEH